MVREHVRAAWPDDEDSHVDGLGIARKSKPSAAAGERVLVMWRRLSRLLRALVLIMQQKADAMD